MIISIRRFKNCNESEKVTLHPRFATARVQTALADTRVVLLTGPRQAGKTTLAQSFAGASRPYLSLDDPAVRDAARADPTYFVARLDRVILDEIQRAPGLLMAIKRSVDEDGRPGRFLLTGSANILTVPTVGDSLAGRIEIIDLLPLSQCELRGSPSDFLARTFSGEPPRGAVRDASRGLEDMVLTGGYPEALARTSEVRRRRWHRDYLRTLIERDVREISRIEHVQRMPRLLAVLAHHAGQLGNFSNIGSSCDINHTTTRHYIETLRSMYLIDLLQAWSTHQLNRLVKAPKLHFLDSGLQTALAGLSRDSFSLNRKALGPALETFVYAELRKLASWEDDPPAFYHFRDKEKNEVDIVLEDRRGRVVGIEVKATSTPGLSTLRGLQKLAATCGPRFVQGLVLCDHPHVLPMGERLYAAPVDLLWQ